VRGVLLHWRVSIAETWSAIDAAVTVEGSARAGLYWQLNRECCIMTGVRWQEIRTSKFSMFTAVVV